jgi:phosphoglucomutase
VNSDILQKARLWTTDRFDEKTRAEIQALLDREDGKELADRFYRELEFGTGGMRGVMEAGSNRMNVYTVGRATQGLADYLLRESSNLDGVKTRGVAIAHDSRVNSHLFARETARVLAANSIRVYLFRELRPTPLLSFTVRHLGCAAGVVLTASHNPGEYNGYKVYGPDGGQVTNPEDARIVEYVNRVDISSGVKRMEYDQGVKEGLIEEIEEGVEEAYLDRVAELTAGIEEGIAGESGRAVGEATIVYTPLHGTGITLIPRALQSMGARLICEEEQSRVDGTFPTTPSPNPEDPAALGRAIELAKKHAADIVVGTDPDCDRMGVAVPDGRGGYTSLTGNQVGCLFAHLLAHAYRAAGRMPENPVMISTIVSTPMIHGIAADFGVSVVEVLTGFKYIARWIRDNEGAGGGAFLYAFEESYGYMAGTFGRDKDAVVATALAVLLVQYAKGRESFSGGTGASPVIDLLYDLYARYGVYREFQNSFTFKGVEGARKIESVMEQLRASPPGRIGGRPVTRIRDFLRRREILPAEDRETDMTDLPVSDVLQFQTDELRVSARPSGTEPKIKFYFALHRPVSDASFASIEKSMEEAENRYREVSADLFAPYQL